MAGANDPYCRLCSNLLKNDAGCDACLPSKQHICWPQLDSEHQSVEELAHETALTLRHQLRLVRKDQKSQTDYNPAITKEAALISNSLTKIISELRKFETDQANRAKVMTHQERQSAICDWFSNLPQNAQRDFIQACTQLYNNDSMKVFQGEKALG